MSASPEELFDALVSNRIAPSAFSHRDHVAAAMGALRDRPFLDALAQYGAGLQRLTERAGVPEKFNVTLTAAFMSLIAQAMREFPAQDPSVDALIARAPHLLDAAVMRRWWSEAELSSPAARAALLLPTGVSAEPD